MQKFLDPRNDVAFKKVFGNEQHKEVVIHFINDVLEFKGDDKIRSVKFLTPIQDPEIASKKQSVVDVLCEDSKGVKIIIEMQFAHEKGFEKRAQYYASKAYSRQMNKGKENKYVDLKRVIFIAITNYTIFPEKKDFKSDHVILDKKTYANDLKDFSFTFIDLTKFDKTSISELENILDKWCFFFKYAEDTTENDLERIITNTPVIKTAYDIINRFNWNEQELLAYEQETKRVMDIQAALDSQYDKGQEQGMEKGKEIGRKEGKEIGRKEGKEIGREEGIQIGEARGKEEEKLAIAHNLLSQNIDTSTITLATGLSIEQIEKLKNS